MSRATEYATKIIKRDSKAKTIGEARREMQKLMREKPHQFSLVDKVTTYEQARQRANYFSEVNGHYPAGMSVCYTVGLSGDCGSTCPDFKHGICENGEEVVKDVLADKNYKLNNEDKEVFEMYTDLDNYIRG